MAKKNYNTALKRRRSEYYQEKISSCDRDPRQLFKTMGQLAGNVKTKITPHFGCDAVVTEKMSNFYVQKIDDLRTNIKNTNGQTNHTLLQSINKKMQH